MSKILFRCVNFCEPNCVADFVGTEVIAFFGDIRDSVIPRFKQQIEWGGPVTVTHPEITRYFMTILEACSLVLEAGCMGKGGEIFVFDMGKAIRVAELAEKMIRLAGLVPGKDISIEFTGLRPGEKLYEELLNDQENALPTHHEKIMIGKVREYPFDWVQRQVSDWLQEHVLADAHGLVMQMKRIVPEFKSMNSSYEILDQTATLAKVENGTALDLHSIHHVSTFLRKKVDA